MPGLNTLCNAAKCCLEPVVTSAFPYSSQSLLYGIGENGLYPGIKSMPPARLTHDRFFSFLESNLTKHITLRDGRTLAFDTYGDPNGTPVIFSHGFSDSHVIRHPDDSVTASLGVRWIAADEPGVGGSSPKKGRKMVDWGADMEELADHMGLDTFNVAGHSGGGPHALAVAFHMPERVRKVALASPVAPFDEPGVTKMLVLKDLKPSRNCTI